jgi:LysM repeat protein
MANKKVSISIREQSTGKYYKIPVLPEEIAYSFGDALKDSVTVIDLGTVDFHSGNDLDSMGWSSFFPARYDAGYCTTSKLLTTLEYKDLFERWKSTGARLQLICPAAGINEPMVLYSFKAVFKGAEMDLYYQVEFKKKRTIKPVKVDLGAIMSKAKSKKDPKNRESIPDKEKPGTYTVKSGDTLTRIAKVYGITPWKILYEKNKNTIGTDPGSIKAGQVLKL